METTERTKEAKYMEGYLEFKEASKWVNYWVVIRGFQLFFYKNPNTHINENIQFHLDIGAKSNFVSGKSSKNKFEFEVKVERGKKYLFRANTEADRLQWVYTLGLAAQGKLPPTSFASDPDPRDESYNKKTVTKTTSNQYSEVPNFRVSPDVAGVSDEEMQKKIMSLKKANSFSSYCKNLVGLKDKRNTSKSVDSEESCPPEPVQAEAEAYYDPFPGSIPPWYFGKVTRENAEKVLEEHPPGSYLVRDSETVTKPGAYTISLRHREKFRHHKVETLQDGNLVIKTCEDKVFPNLAMLMNYFTKSQEREIVMRPVYCKDQVDNGVRAIQPEGFEPNDPRPPVPGCEDISSRPERSSGYVSPGASTKHSYENLPDKVPKAKPPLRSRATSPDLCRTHGYENLPNKDRRSMSNGTPPPDLPAGYELMTDKGAPAPALPPRRAPSKINGYENLPSKGAEPLPSRRPSCEGYVNLPARQDRPASSGPPPLPPKTPSQGLQGYENLPTKDTSSLRTRNFPQENIGVNGRQRYSVGNMVPKSSAAQQPAPFRRSATVPAHIIQNTLEKGT